MAACEGASNERVVQYILDSFSGDHAAFEKYINLRDNVIDTLAQVLLSV